MLRSRSLLLFLVAVAGVTQAQFYPPQRGIQRQQAQQTGTITLSGIVVNSVTGEPIPRALIQMSGMVSRVALTDAEGRFQFENLPETQAMLMAHKPGFFSEMELRQGMSRLKPTVITAGMGAVTVKLSPAGVVSGRVTTADGEPVESAGVSLKVRMIQNGRRQLMNRTGATTDEDGYFRIGNLQPGTYYLYSNGFSRLTTASDEVYAPAYYPGVSDVSGASAIDVRAGSTTIADLTLRKEKAYRVSGVVTGLLPNQSAQVELLGPDGENLPVRSAVRDGNTFELRRVPAGSYTLKVFSQQRMNRASGSGATFVTSMGPGAPRMPQLYTGSIPLNVNGDVTNVSVSVQPAATIPVIVRTDFTNKQTNNEGGSGSIGNSRRNQQNVMLHLIRTDGQRGDNYAQMSGGPDNMSLSLQNVEPGRYHVEFMPMGNTYVRSATYGNTDILRDDLVVAGGDSQPIDVVVRDDPASLSGTAHCEDTQCWVLIVPDGTTAIQPRQAFVDPQGGFQQMGLAPGSYRIYAVDRVEGIEYANPEAMKAFGAHAETVVLSAGQKAQVNVELTKVSDQ